VTQQPLIRYKMPVIKGTPFNGEYMEALLDPLELRI